MIDIAERYPKELFTGTRSFALKGSLLSKNAIETLAESKSLEELINRLKATPYASAVSKLAQPYSALRLELAVRERLADVHHSLMRTAESYDLLQLYYFRNIAWNLKVALKSRALGRSFEEAVNYIDLHSEELIGRRELIAKVLSAKDIQEATNLLSGTEFGKDVARATSLFASNKEVQIFDLFVDHALFSMIAAAFSVHAHSYSPISTGKGAVVREMVGADIDSYNVLSLLRAKLWDLPTTEARGLIVIPAFVVSIIKLHRMVITESVVEAAKLLSGTPYEGSQPASSTDEETIAALEAKFAEVTRAAASRAFLWEGFGLGPVLGLIKLLEFEVKNLAAIAFGVESGLPSKNLVASLKV